MIIVIRIIKWIHYYTLFLLRIINGFFVIKGKHYKICHVSLSCLSVYVLCIFSYNSFVRINIAEIFFNDHDVTNVFGYHRSAIMSRIDYFESNEPRR